MPGFGDVEFPSSPPTEDPSEPNPLAPLSSQPVGDVYGLRPGTVRSFDGSETFGLTNTGTLATIGRPTTTRGFQVPFEIDTRNGPGTPAPLINPHGTFLGPGAINELAPRPPAEIRGNIAGAYTPIPLVYGKARVLGKLYYWSTDTWFAGVYVFCRGEINNFIKLSIDGRQIDVSSKGTAEFTDSTLTGANGYCQLFLGTSGQDVSGATVSGRVSNWTTDTYANFACVAIQLSRQDFDLRQVPRVEAIIEGTKDVYDPRNSPTYAYTNNAALCLNHFLTTYFDSGTSADDTTLTEAADRCDGIGAGNTLSDSSKRHTWGMVVGDKPTRIDRQAAFLESAARVYAWEEDGTWYYTADATTSSTHTIDETRIVKGSATLRGVSATEQPDDVRVRFTNLDDNTIGLAEALGNVSGRTQEVSMPWITSHAEAKRAAVERYNHLVNENLLLTFDYFSEGLELRRGEVFTYTDATLGLSSQDFRCTRIELRSPGIWRVYGREYLASTYSDSIATDPVTGVGTPNDSAISPPTLSGLAGTATAVGRLARIDLTWTDPDYAFYDQVRVDVYDATNSPTDLLGTYYTTETDSISISGLPADVDFSVDARVISTAGVNGAIAAAAVAKPVLPTPPAVSSATIDMLEPVLVGSESAIRIEVKWDEVDYRAWLQYRVDVYRDENSGNLSDSDIANRVPDQQYILPQGGRGTIDLVAPSSETYGVFGDIYRFKMYAVNATGDESDAYDIQAPGQLSATLQDLHWLGQSESLFPGSDDLLFATGSSKFYFEDLGDDGNGNHKIGFSGTIPGGLLAGFWINVYNCNSGGTISGLLKRVFISGGRMNYQHGAATAYTGSNNYGMHVFDGSVFNPLAKGASGNEHCVVFVPDTPGARYYRFKVQFAGAGAQATQEFDCYEYTATTTTVLGPI